MAFRSPVFNRAQKCFGRRTGFGFLLLLLTPLIASAQQQGIIMNGIPGCNFSTGQLASACIPLFIGHIVQFIFMLIGIFFLMSIIWGGYMITLASIQGQERSKGYNRLIYSIVGFLVAACAFIIMDVVLSILLG